MNEGPLTKAQFEPLCLGQILKADNAARNIFWTQFPHHCQQSHQQLLCQGVSLMCWKWHSAMLSHMEIWKTWSWVCRKSGGEDRSEDMLVWQVHHYLVTEVIEMDTPCGLAATPPKFLILFSGKHNQEKRSEMQSRSALLSAIKFRLSCSAQPSCRFKNMLCSWFNHHVAKQSNAMEGENEAVRYLWCYPNGFTKDIHKALVAQIQKKIKQYEIDSLSPFWEFFSQYFASRVCWFCTSTSASASFQTGSMFCVLFIAGSFSSISNFPSYSLDREHRYDVERKRFIWSPLYLVTDWHGMSPLKTQKKPV